MGRRDARTPGPPIRRSRGSVSGRPRCPGRPASVEAIVADLDARRHPLHVAIQNWAHDFNIGSIIRTGNAFNVAGVHIVGRRRWNRRGAMVTDRYLHVHHHPDVASLVDHCRAQGLTMIGVDNLPGAVPLEGVRLPERCCLVFGSEGGGLTDELADACAMLVSITQYGSTRSINAGAAAAIAMYHWALQHAGGGDGGVSDPTGRPAGGSGRSR